MVALPSAARVSAILNPMIDSVSGNVRRAVRSSVQVIGDDFDNQRSTDDLSTANGNVMTIVTRPPVGVSVNPVQSTYGAPFTVMRTAEPGSIPVGAADADGVADALGEGDPPASVEPQAPRTRAATRAMAFIDP